VPNLLQARPHRFFVKKIRLTIVEEELRIAMVISKLVPTSWYQPGVKSEYGPWPTSPAMPANLA
jgi:hypothetical protein